MSGWEKFKILSTGISAIVIAIAAILIPFFIEKAYKEGEIKAKYVEIAVQILKESPIKKTKN